MEVGRRASSRHPSVNSHGVIPVADLGLSAASRSDRTTFTTKTTSRKLKGTRGSKARRGSHPHPSRPSQEGFEFILHRASIEELVCCVFVVCSVLLCVDCCVVCDKFSLQLPAGYAVLPQTKVGAHNTRAKTANTGRQLGWVRAH